MGYHSIQWAVEILLVVSCYRNRDKLQPDGLLGSYANLIAYMYPFMHLEGRGTVTESEWSFKNHPDIIYHKFVGSHVLLSQQCLFFTN